MNVCVHFLYFLLLNLDKMPTLTIHLKIITTNPSNIHEMSVIGLMCDLELGQVETGLQYDKAV